MRYEDYVGVFSSLYNTTPMRLQERLGEGLHDVYGLQ
jgi:hypothetical protein